MIYTVSIQSSWTFFCAGTAQILSIATFDSIIAYKYKTVKENVKMQEMKPYMTIQEACKYTGLSQHYLRQGCRDNTVPHIMAGAK